VVFRGGEGGKKKVNSILPPSAREEKTETLLTAEKGRKKLSLRLLLCKEGSNPNERGKGRGRVAFPFSPRAEKKGCAEREGKRGRSFDRYEEE